MLFAPLRQKLSARALALLGTRFDADHALAAQMAEALFARDGRAMTAKNLQKLQQVICTRYVGERISR
jgi:hypothetical protein